MVSKPPERGSLPCSNWDTGIDLHCLHGVNVGSEATLNDAMQYKLENHVPFYMHGLNYMYIPSIMSSLLPRDNIIASFPCRPLMKNCKIVRGLGTRLGL